MSSLNPTSPVETITPLIDTPETEDTLNTKQVLLKFVLVGDAFTGKTSIMNQFDDINSNNTFDENYIPTLNPLCCTKQIIIDDTDNDKKYIIQLQLWDTSGKHPSSHSFIDSNNNSNNDNNINDRDDYNLPNTTLNNNEIPRLSQENSFLRSEKHPKCTANKKTNKNRLMSIFTGTGTKKGEHIDNKQHIQTLNDREMAHIENKPLLHEQEQIKSDRDDAVIQTLLDLLEDGEDENDDDQYQCPVPSEKPQKPSKTKKIEKPEKPKKLKIENISIPPPLIIPPPNNNDRGYSSSSSSTTSNFNGLMFESADGLILVYDITSCSSFFNLSVWINLFMHQLQDNTVPILILGNKRDLENERVIKHKQGRKFCSSLINHTIFYEISAKNDQNNDIKNALTVLARQCIYKESSILQLTSADSLDSINSLKTNFKRKNLRKSKEHSIKTCASNFCSKNGQETEDPFCVVL